MSRNLNRKAAAATTAAEVADRAADQAMHKADRREHEFADNANPDLSGHMLGTQPNDPASVTGKTAADLIEDFSLVGRLTGLRALANGAICSMVFIANDKLAYDGPTEDNGALSMIERRGLERYESLPRRLQLQGELYSWAAAQLRVLATSAYEQPMSLSDALDFAANLVSKPLDSSLPKEIMDALGLDEATLAVIDAEEARKQQQRDATLRRQVRDRAADIASEVGGCIDLNNASDSWVAAFNADQHMALLRKLHSKLGARFNQLIGQRGRFESALSDAMLLRPDIAATDKAVIDFARRNAGELRDDSL